MIATIIFLQEFLQAASEDKTSPYELQASQELKPGPDPQE